VAGNIMAAPDQVEVTKNQIAVALSDTPPTLRAIWPI
jgi:hypothetical protein